MIDNIYVIRDNICSIYIVRENKVVGLFFVDQLDIYNIKDSVWNISKGYVKSTSGKKTLSRLLLNAPSNKLVDHIDGNPLNNKRSNLRLCTRQQNAMNIYGKKANGNGYKGVYLDKQIRDSNIQNKKSTHASNHFGVTYNSHPGRQKRWVAGLMLNYKHITIGYFDTEIEAAQAYNTYVVEHNLNRRLNQWHN